VVGASGDPQELDRQRKRYAFLYDEVIPQERAALKQRLKVRRSVAGGGGRGAQPVQA
jgi:hypothetical protein